MSDRRGRGTLLVGLVILVVGVVLLVDNLAVFQVSLRAVLFSIVLLVVGLFVFTSRLRAGRFDRLFLPSVLVLYGTLSVIEEFAWDEAMDLFVPLLVILVGVFVLTRPWRVRLARGQSGR